MVRLYNIIDESQSGFRNYSVIDNSFILMALTHTNLLKKMGRFYCIFIDFEKAFDSIKYENIVGRIET